MSAIKHFKFFEKIFSFAILILTSSITPFSNSHALTFPFAGDRDWTICQGYNTSEIDHFTGKNGVGSYSFDFVTDPNPARGTYGCTLDGSSEGQSIFSPATGKIRVSNTGPGEFLCVSLDTPEGNVNSVNIGHMAVSNWNTNDAVHAGQFLGKLGKPSNTGWGKAHLHISLWSEKGCKGTNLAFDKYLPGYDFSIIRDPVSNVEIEHQYYGSKVRALNYFPPVFHGTGSLIAPSETCGFGCSKDDVRIHSDNGYPLATFQWAHDSTTCDHIDISAIGDNQSIQQPRVRIRAGNWYNRPEDKDYTGTLPLSIGYPRASFNVAAVTVLDLPSSSYIIRATCKPSNTSTIGDKIEIPLSDKFGILLSNGYYWNGNASVIAKSPSSPQYPWGVKKDVVKMRSKSGVGSGGAFFQWYRDFSCPNVALVNESGNSGNYRVRVRAWNESEILTKKYDNAFIANNLSWAIPSISLGFFNYYLVYVYPQTGASTMDLETIRLECY